MNRAVTKLTRAGIIAALYVALVFPVISVASEMLQFRPSEALCIMPLFYVEAVPALAVGCAIANLLTGCTLLDIVFGSLVTLLAGGATYLTGRLIKNKWGRFFAGGAFPILLNAFLLPVIWYFAYGELDALYIVNVGCLTLTQSTSIYLLGAFLYTTIYRLREKKVSVFL